jgi:hypothetical protein
VEYLLVDIEPAGSVCHARSSVRLERFGSIFRIYCGKKIRPFF